MTKGGLGWVIFFCEFFIYSYFLRQRAMTAPGPPLSTPLPPFRCGNCDNPYAVGHPTDRGAPLSLPVCSSCGYATPIYQDVRTTGPPFVSQLANMVVARKISPERLQKLSSLTPVVVNGDSPAYIDEMFFKMPGFNTSQFNVGSHLDETDQPKLRRLREATLMARLAFELMGLLPELAAQGMARSGGEYTGGEHAQTAIVAMQLLVDAWVADEKALEQMSLHSYAAEAAHQTEGDWKR